MPKLVGGIACVAALTAGIFGGVDPLLCLSRAGVAFAGGSVLGALWQALLAAPARGVPASGGGSDAGTSADG